MTSRTIIGSNLRPHSRPGGFVQRRKTKKGSLYSAAREVSAAADKILARGGNQKTNWSGFSKWQ